MRGGVTDQVARFQPSSSVARLGLSSNSDNFEFLCEDDMSFALTIRKMMPSMRHDYIRRHRITRRITNVALVVILSALAGYFITVQPKKAFSPPEKNSAAEKGANR